MVNGEAIGVEAVRTECVAVAGRQALDQLIDERLIDDAAGQRGIVVRDCDVAARKARLTRELGSGGIESLLSARGVTPALFDDSLRHEMELGRLAAGPVRPARHMRHVRHVVVALVFADPKTGMIRTRTKADALKIVGGLFDRLRGGEPFDKVARSVTDYTAGQQSGGDVGILYAGSVYWPRLYPVAMGLRAGEYTHHPMLTEAGYEIVYVQSTAENHPRSEDALYAAADAAYRLQQIDDAEHAMLATLRERARITRLVGASAATAVRLASTPPVTDNQTVAALVEGRPIATTDVEARALELAGGPMLQHLIASLVIDQAARAADIAVTAADLDVKKTELVARLGGKTLNQALNERGMTMPELESQLDDQIKLEKLACRNTRPATHMRRVLHIAIQAKDANPFAAGGGPPIPGPPLPTREEALAKLGMIRASIEAGASFTDLARRYSDDIFSKPLGGDLGVLHDGTQVNRDILAVALTLGKGEISQPFKSFFGYDMVYVESTQEDHPAAEDALYAEADAEYRDSQADALTDQVLRSLCKKAKVTIYFQP